MKYEKMQKSIEPAKIHDLNELDRKLNPRCGIPEADLLYLTAERIPSFYGAEDLIPDQNYTQEDSDHCIKMLNAIGI